MSLGLPGHLAPQSQSRAFAKAAHAAAFTCIVGGLFTALAFQLAWPAVIAWPAAVALVPMAVVLYLVDRSRTRFFSSAYLIVGGASVYWYTLTFAAQFDLGELAGVLTTSLPKTALVLVGGSGLGPIAALRWCTAGYLVAEGASSVARMQSDGLFAFDLITGGAYLITVVILAFAWITSRPARRAGPRLHRAARDEIAAAIRRRVELRAAALLHDTVLNNLAAIAASSPGPLSPALTAELSSDLDVMLGGKWLDEPPPTDPADLAAWTRSPPHQAIREAEALGLEVDVTGDLAAVARLEPAASAALGLAVKQCLVNVLAHSGETDAEVAIHAFDSEVLVMVIDTGRGFTESQVGSDRLGLRNSVRARIESVGGSVQIWSTADRGTSILLRVPARRERGTAEQHAPAGLESL